ncbi:unnamed protein product [Paramecium octaurelia]|uniref:Uncharacterized protein n=1 Tax=Paramecium octaurelia TaxID=43137 RepID=A0A8S1XKF6_PAROT|nr:unnamed protein product [Paramecium octaurelia]
MIALKSCNFDLGNNKFYLINCFNKIESPLFQFLNWINQNNYLLNNTMILQNIKNNSINHNDESQCLFILIISLNDLEFCQFA